jgi:hypothetical protein
VEIFNLGNLNELEIREAYQIEISNRFAAVENLNNSRTEIRLGKLLNSISKPQLKRV